MVINRGGQATELGSSKNFTGLAFIDVIARPAGSSRVQASHVHFAPGARTAWHRHPHGQTIWVTDGAGRCQRRGGGVELIKAGDRVFFEPDEEHWHGADVDRFMAHLAMVQTDEQGHSATWLDHVSDADYTAAPASPG